MNLELNYMKSPSQLLEQMNRLNKTKHDFKEQLQAQIEEHERELQRLQEVENEKKM